MIQRIEWMGRGEGFEAGKSWRTAVALLRRVGGVSGYAETVVGVLEAWGDAGAGGAARYFNVMAPRTAAGGAAGTFSGAAGISFQAFRIIFRVVPIDAPLVDVLAHIE